ncbi:ankyrin repeat-containing domain protein [Morchella snyderi]|nr:ankyrin repeat-containing domain protein [Morchella snyderi]
MPDECFRARQIPRRYTLDSLIQVLERLPHELEGEDITVDRRRSSLVQCCYSPSTRQTAIIHFSPRPPTTLDRLRFGSTYSLEISPQDSDILIDKNFYGLTQLYTPSKNIKLDVIAISGLNGHAYGSWAGEADSEGRKKMWLRHFFERDRPECRTMIYGYNSRLREPGIHTLSDYSRGLLEEIYKAREGCEDRPVALIGHSFGGIIIADAIVRDKETPRGNLFKMTKTIVFFATPHRGLLFDDILEMVGEGSPRLDLIHAIKRVQEAEHLRSFTDYAEEGHFGVVSFRETMETRKVKKDSVTGNWARTGEYYTAVERDSSILNLPRQLEDIQSAEGNHSSLVKFDNQSNHAYTTLCGRLRLLLNYIEQASSKALAEINTKLRLPVSRSEHQLVSVLLTLGRADPNAEDIEGRSLSAAVPTEDTHMLRLLLRHGAQIDIRNTHPGYATIVQYDDPMKELRKRPEEETELNHRKGDGTKHKLLQNNLSIRRGKILAWLSMLAPEDDHNRISGKRHENTGQWFLDSTEVREWLGELEVSLLWCYGNPGVGKSVLTSTLLESINTKYEPDTAIGIAYFYFNFQITVTLEDVLRIWIKQLCRRMDELPSSLYDLHKACIDNDVKPKRRQLEDLFQKVVNYFKQVFLVIDALDEHSKESRNDLVNYLSQVSGSYKIFIASRREVDIERNILSAKFEVLPIQVTKVDEDIGTYVDHELKNRNQDHCAISKTLKTAIRTRLMQQANGMFLWVKCQLDFIYEQPSLKDIREALDSLPTTMHDTYGRILKRINEQTEATRNLAHRALAWVITAKRPLTIRELVLAVALESTTKSCQELEWVYSQDVVLSSCCGLVTNDCGTVRPIHFTVQEFLNTRDLEHLEGISTGIFLTQSILVYLRSLGVMRRCTTKEGCVIRSTSVLGLDLLQYACSFLGLHLRDAGNPLPDCLLSLVRSLLANDYDVLRWAILAICGNPERAMPDDSDEYSQVCYVSDDYDIDFNYWISVLDHLNTGFDDWRFGLDDWNEYIYVDDRVERAICTSTSRECSLSPLGLLSGLGLLPVYFQLFPNEDVTQELNGVLNDVARGGSVPAIEELLDRGCDIDSCDSYGNTPLITAASSGCGSVVLFLLARGADVHSLNKMGNSALYYACEDGMVDAVKILLERDADFKLNVKGLDALYHAVCNGDTAVVQTLLAARADVNCQAGKHGTSLQAAASCGRTEIFKILLAAGADVNLQGGKYGTALQAAAHNSSEEIVKILLDAGVDVNFQAGKCGIALQAAADTNYRGGPEIVKVLLDAGADVNFQGGEYGTALQAAAQRSSEIVKVLLAAGAHVNLQGGKYGTALQAAVQNDKEEIVKILLDAGADVNLQGGKYGTALQAAACSGYPWTGEMVTILLDAGADVNLQAGKHGTSLQAAASCGRTEIFKILLAAGADVNLQGGEYGTALQAAACADYLWAGEVVKMLLDAGADVNLQGGEYGTALQAAASTGYTWKGEIVKMLLDAGADVNLQGGEYGTALQAAASTGYTWKGEIVKMLLDAGADVNLQGGTYGTALQAAAVSGSIEKVKILLEAGADVNIEGGFYGSARGAAMRGSHQMVLDLLNASM